MQRTYTYHDVLHGVPKFWHVQLQMHNEEAPLLHRSHEKLRDVWHKVSQLCMHDA
jgi:hypothetical protein